MRTVDLVRFGSMAMELPEIGTLYTQLLHDGVVGRKHSPGMDAFARAMGVRSRRTVSRALDALEDWGVLERSGSTRNPRYRVHRAPNLTFCRAVVSAMFGTEALLEVETGSRRAELCPTTGPRHPVADYAIATLFTYYGDKGFYTPIFTDPSPEFNLGYVFGDSDWGQALSKESDILVYVSTAHRAYSIEHLAPNDGLAHYTPVPLLDLAMPTVTTKTQRAAKARKNELPQSSQGFVYWKRDDLVKDVAWYPTITELIEYGNGLFRIGENLNWQLYIQVRNCLVEEDIPVDQIRKAFKAASIDPFWKDKASIGKLCKDPNRIRELSRKSTHDRYARSQPAIPKPDHVYEEYVF